MKQGNILQKKKNCECYDGVLIINNSVITHLLYSYTNKEILTIRPVPNSWTNNKPMIIKMKQIR